MNLKKYLKYFIPAVLLLIAFITGVIVRQGHTSMVGGEYSGTQSCRSCHEKFYRLWDGSHHGLAMQPVTGEFLRSIALNGTSFIQVGDLSYLPVAGRDSLYIMEYGNKNDTLNYRAIYVMGGKYVYYFLTMLQGGRLQVLPIAFDLKTNSWYNNPESGVRHFPDLTDRPVDWKSYPYTFNTSCYSCHVSQLTTNYDPAEMTYHTEWREPGINCETCHGPAVAHINIFEKADSGEVVADMKIISTKRFTSEQHNSLCGSCHARMIPVASSFTPGDYFYNAFDLVTPENPDFYADGRDLGENYTYTSWEMNKCRSESDLNCVTCHTSSGRYKFKDNPNGACMPCHESKVKDSRSHTRHDPSGAAGQCVACHMPKTTFARMERSDHSFRPPSPAASIEFGSPNACNICHTDKTIRWANETVIKEKGDYQDGILYLGRLMKEARANDWHNAVTIAEGIRNESINPAFAAAFIRLAEAYNAKQMHEAILNGTRHSSPLVRAAAAYALTYPVNDETTDRLIELTRDSVNLVRLYAGYALSMMPGNILLKKDTSIVRDAMTAYAASLITRKDQWGSWYNLGNFYAGLGDQGSAVASYNMAAVIYPGATVALVNAGFVYSQIGETDKAESSFLRALQTDSLMEAANLNIALLYGETGRLQEAEKYFKKTLVINPENPVAAYNLAIIISDREPEKALELSRVGVKFGNGAEKYKNLYNQLLKGKPF